MHTHTDTQQTTHTHAPYSIEFENPLSRWSVSDEDCNPSNKVLILSMMYWCSLISNCGSERAINSSIVSASSGSSSTSSSLSLTWPSESESESDSEFESTTTEGTFCRADLGHTLHTKTHPHSYTHAHNNHMKKIIEIRKKQSVNSYAIARRRKHTHKSENSYSCF